MRFILIMLATAISAFAANPAAACSCGCNRDAAASLREIPVLFRGRMVAVTTAGYDRVYRFEVVSVYKGKLPARVSVRTNQGSAACGAQFEANAEVLVGAYERGGGLRTTLCTQVCMSPRLAEIEKILAACKPGAPCPPEP
jgi:hypothetical protein